MLAGAASWRSGRARSTNWLTAAAVRSAEGSSARARRGGVPERLRIGFR